MVIVEEDAAMNAMPKCLLYLEKKVAKTEREKGLLAKSMQSYLHLQDEKWLRVPAWEMVLLKLLLPWTLPFALHVESYIVWYCCR